MKREDFEKWLRLNAESFSAYDCSDGKYRTYAVTIELPEEFEILPPISHRDYK
jgi:hypothetical protein